MVEGMVEAMAVEGMVAVMMVEVKEAEAMAAELARWS